MGHVLGTAPPIGRRYEIATLPISGRRETILKTAHDLTDQSHLTMFGAQARHPPDMGDLDENHFVPLGGQDGWINSTTFADQLTCSRAGDTMIILDHTEVPGIYRGRSIGAAPVARAVEDARRGGVRVVPLCPFAAAQYRRHPEWHDVLDHGGRLRT